MAEVAGWSYADWSDGRHAKDGAACEVRCRAAAIVGIVAATGSDGSLVDGCGMVAIFGIAAIASTQVRHSSRSFKRSREPTSTAWGYSPVPGVQAVIGHCDLCCALDRDKRQRRPLSGGI